MLKHAILDWYHPLPARVRVFPGAPGTLEYAIVRRVLRHVGDLHGTLAVVAEEAPADDESLGAPAVWIDDAPDPSGTGWACVCRYIGRLWRAYPITPAHALRVDVHLDQLARFVAEGGARWRAHARHLEAHLLLDSDFLDGFDACTIADLAWAGAFQWLTAVRHETLDELATPHLALWRAVLAQEA